MIAYHITWNKFIIYKEAVFFISFLPEVSNKTELLDECDQEHIQVGYKKKS